MYTCNKTCINSFIYDIIVIVLDKVPEFMMIKSMEYPDKERMCFNVDEMDDSLSFS